MMSLKHVAVATFVLSLVLSGAAQAAPAPKGPKACLANQIMMSDGETTYCKDFSDTLTFMCPEGKVLQGLAYGKMICVDGPKPVMAGQYQWSGSGRCRYPNPLTKSCTCPEGYEAIPSLEFHDPRCAYKFMENDKKVKSCSETQFTCYLSSKIPN